MLYGSLRSPIQVGIQNVKIHSVIQALCLCKALLVSSFNLYDLSLYMYHS